MICDSGAGEEKRIKYESMDLPESSRAPRRRRSFTRRLERPTVSRRSYCDLDLLSSSSGFSAASRLLISNASFEQDLAVLQEEANRGGFHNMRAPMKPNMHKRDQSAVIYDTPAIQEGYSSVPLLDHIQLPRGGISIQTKAVGAVQFGIPPETIKDSMRLGLEVPRVFIVPVERFCREIGPALGINLAEFE